MKNVPTYPSSTDEVKKKMRAEKKNLLELRANYDYEASFPSLNRRFIFFLCCVNMALRKTSRRSLQSTCTRRNWMFVVVFFPLSIKSRT